MSWESYLKRLEVRNPQLANPETRMRITVRSFLRSLEQAYQEGRKDEGKAQKVLDSILPKGMVW